MLLNKCALLLELKPHAEHYNAGPAQMRSRGHLELTMYYRVFIYIMSEFCPSLFLFFLFFSPFLSLSLLFFFFLVLEIRNINPAARRSLCANGPGPVKLWKNFCCCNKYLREWCFQARSHLSLSEDLLCTVEPGSHSVATYDFMENSVLDSLYEEVVTKQHFKLHLF